MSLKIMKPAELPSGMISRLTVSVVADYLILDSPLCLVVQTANPPFRDNDVQAGIAHLDCIALFVYYFVSRVSLIRVTYQ